jgi:hypothetical protein
MGLKEQLVQVQPFVYKLPENTVQGQRVPVYFYLSDRLFETLEEGLEKVLGDLVARGKGTVAEEIPQAYKDVSEVVRVVDSLGIAKLVLRLKPLGTLKG